MSSEMTKPRKKSKKKQSILSQILTVASSLKLALFCLVCFLVLVFWGTLDQVNLGIYYAQKKYFQSIFVWHNIAGFNMPVFPGGFLLGSLMIINLAAVIPVRKLYQIGRAHV